MQFLSNLSRFAALAAGLTALAGAASAQTYTWIGSSSNLFTDSANWLPTRTTPATTDELVFNGSATTSVVTAIPDQTVAKVRFQSGADIRFDNTSIGTAITRTLTLGGGAGGFLVDAGSTFTLGGGNTNIIIVSLSAGTTGSISGSVIFNANTANTPHRLRVLTAGGLAVESGGSVAQAPGTLTGGNVAGAQGGFNLNSTTGDAGNSVANSVIFRSGSTFYQGGTPAGVRNGGTGSTPFGLTAPAALVVFEPGSTFVNLGGIPSLGGRTYGNFVWRDGFGAVRDLGGGSTQNAIITGDALFLPPGGSRLDGVAVAPGSITLTVAGQAVSGGTAIEFQGDFIVTSGSAAITETATPASDRYLVFRKNWTIDAPGKFVPTQDTDRFYVLQGTGPQTVDLKGTTITRLNNWNLTTVTLASDLRISQRIDVGSGTLVTGANRVIAPDTPGVARTGTGFVDGTFERTISTSVLGARSLPVGKDGKYTPASINILTASVPSTGTVTVTVTPTDHPNVPNAAEAINRFWTITPSNLGIYSASVTLTYDESDLGAANESLLKPAQRIGGNWTVFNGPSDFTLDPVGNAIRAVTVSDISGAWTAFESVTTAAAKDWMLY
jgi:hypothetical protein